MMPEVYKSLDALVSEQSKHAFNTIADNQISMLKGTRKEIDNMIRGIRALKGKYGVRGPARRFVVYAALAGLISIASYSPASNVASAPHRQEITQSAQPAYATDRYQCFHYFVRPNDTLSGIAQRITGDPTKWKAIMEHNKLSSTVIEVNQVLDIPCIYVRDQNQVMKGNLKGCYEVLRRGEDLAEFAKRTMGSPAYASQILAHNRRINPLFSDRLYERQWVFLPR
jgi:LysM domain